MGRQHHFERTCILFQRNYLVDPEKLVKAELYACTGCGKTTKVAHRDELANYPRTCPSPPLAWERLFEENGL